jgi:hypothetical protein
VAPGQAPSLPPAEVARLLLVGFAGLSDRQVPTVIGDLAETAQRTGGLRQLRVFRGTGTATDALWAIGEFDRPVSVDPLAAVFGQAGGVGARLLNLYAPYHRGG